MRVRFAATSESSEKARNALLLIEKGFATGL